MAIKVGGEHKHPFLRGGREMGHLIESYNWSDTSVGPIERWPQTLKTILGVILWSELPMLLWWGEELIQFYNDAYRSTLGTNGKHPKALGQSAKDCWPEVWDVVFPLVKQVLSTGKSFFKEDEHGPIFRNGKIEEAYWTYCYSPVIGIHGEIEGILIICNETTKRIQALKETGIAQKNLERKEDNLRNLILQSPVAMCVLNGPDFIVEIANDKMFELWGKSRDQILNKSILAGLPEVRNQGFDALLDKVYRTGETFSAYGLPIKLPRSGLVQTVYVNFVYAAFRNDKNLITGIMVVANDVTEQFLASKKLEESEQRYKTLIAESTVAIALYQGPDLRIQYVNDIMTGYWGKDSSVIGKPLEEAVPELIGQPFPRLLREVYVSGGSYVGKEERAMLHVDGKLQPFYFNYIYKAIKNQDGETYGIHHMAMDVTEQVRARQQLEQSEANLRNIIQMAPVAMGILRGPSNVFESVNKKMVELLGLRFEDVVNHPLVDALPTVAKSNLQTVIQNVYSTGNTHKANEQPFQLPRNGQLETVYVNYVLAPLKEAEELITGILTTAIDVTEQVIARVRIEEKVEERTKELAELNTDLQRSNDQLEQFAYIASHDLQEPARKISTYVEMLQKTVGDIDPRSKKYLDKIETSSSRMLTLIRDVLAFSQLGKATQEFSSVNLNTVLDTIKEDFELLIEEKKAVITSNALPTIEGIPVQISQLFSNLISNALKFTVGNQPPVITIESTEVAPHEIGNNPALSMERKYFKIVFHDNGIGFNQENAGQIFDIFQRLHGLNEYTGTGIGLAMCKRIAGNHNGDIYAESTIGKGASFHVILPVNQTRSRTERSAE